MAGSDLDGDAVTRETARETGQPPTERNRLAGSSSPYLRQHADNPVNWQPWDDEALAAAREQDRPILLSIGYSACHWCHVMAHESFEDPATAKVMNKLFINIKVDREERPDLDRIYQVSHQLLAQRPGGWPLTLVLSPEDLTPYFAGTYFPREARFGMPGFVDVLQRVHGAWNEQRNDVRKQNDNLRQVMMRLDSAPADAKTSLSYKPLIEARRRLETQFDSENGGMAGAPKFPHPANLQLLLRHAIVENDMPAQRLVMFSLRRMGERGLFDHLGGGFFRYCVDARWEIPHFEKMLYDNGPLLDLYAKAWRRSGEEEFRRIAEQTGRWVIREMQSEGGGFYSSLDADSEGREGAFYIWTPEEVSRALGESITDQAEADELIRLVNEHYGIDDAPNFDDHWHLNIRQDVDSLASERDADPEEMQKLLDSAKSRLLEFREQRLRPDRDDKILTSWNALMIKGLASAGAALEREDFDSAARRALDYLRKYAWKDNRLHAVISGEQTLYPAYLDDYAFLIDAILTLLEARWDSTQIHFARDLADVMLDDFEDKMKGGFFFTADYHDNPVRRLKSFSDDAMPNGNGVAARALFRLGRLLGDMRYIEAADRTLRAAWEDMNTTPHGHASLLLALREALDEPPTIILRGEPQMMAIWRERMQSAAPPHALIFAIPSDADDLPEAIANRETRGDCVAYVCEGFQCSSPLTDRDNLHAYLKERYPG